MRWIALLGMVTLIASPGCQLASNAPNPQWLTDFQNTNTILVRKDQHETTIRDAETISRLQGIYSKSKWSPYWHTLPGNLGDMTIELLDGDTKLRHFSYTGTLWETESYTENRTAQLNPEDKQWIESLFATLAEGESPPESKIAK